jgi:glycosyltransferase involved in cell wall biosynthesis
LVKKILIFSTAYLPLIGGAEIAVKETTDRLGGDLIFDLICARIKKELPAQEKIGNINVFRLGCGCGKLDKFLLPWRGAALATKLHAEQKYDLIWAIMASFGGLAALFFKNKNSQVPYLLTLQEGDSPEHIRARARWLGPYWRQMFSKADYLTAISNYLVDFGRKQGATSPIEVVPNGVDLKIFSPEEPISADKIFGLKKNLGINEGEKTIITVSRLVKKNAVDDLVKAAQYLKIPFKMLIIGSGPDEEKLKKLTAQLNLENKILFLGNINHPEIRMYYYIADVFARPSISEGLGNVFLEAMSAGVSVVGTPVGGIPDFLTDGKTGLFCKIKNPASIADKINILLSNDLLRQKLIANGKKLVEQRYNWDKITAQMKKIIDRLII